MENDSNNEQAFSDYVPPPAVVPRQFDHLEILRFLESEKARSPEDKGDFTLTMRVDHTGLCYFTLRRYVVAADPGQTTVTEDYSRIALRLELFDAGSIQQVDAPTFALNFPAESCDPLRVLSDIVGRLPSYALPYIAHRTSVVSGWWDDVDPLDDRSNVNEAAKKLLMIHSEVSEATEELRTNRITPYYNEGNPKPEGASVELADAIVRCFDLLEQWGLDAYEIMRSKMYYNMTRPKRHGGKAL